MTAEAQGKSLNSLAQGALQRSVSAQRNGYPALHWTGHHQLSAPPPHAPCLSLKGSVGLRRCAANFTNEVQATG
jgi:hypothetical protein